MAGFSVDGLHWYATDPAADAAAPVWAGEGGDDDSAAAFRLPEASHEILIPLKEMDLDLQVRNCSI